MKLNKDRFFLILYLIYPLTIGGISAMQGVGRSAAWPTVLRFVYYVPFTVIGVFAAGIGSAIVARLLKPYGARLWLVLPLGVIVSGPVSMLYAIQVGNYFIEIMAADGLVTQPYVFQWRNVIPDSLPAIVLWTSVNLFAYHFLQVERFGYQPPEPDTGERPGPADSRPLPRIQILSRAGLPPNTEILALEAQQHYVKIYTHSKPVVVLYRFSDAVAELDPELGLQVHRSWWVAYNSIDTMDSPSRPKLITLTDGTGVPVSRSYRVLVAQAFSTADAASI